MLISMGFGHVLYMVFEEEKYLFGVKWYFIECRDSKAGGNGSVNVLLIKKQKRKNLSK